MLAKNRLSSIPDDIVKKPPNYWLGFNNIKSIFRINLILPVPLLIVLTLIVQDDPQQPHNL